MMSTQFPTACPAGTYRSSGDTDCRSCPANTMRDQVATDQCQCQDGYFRNDVTRDSTCSSLLTASNERARTGCTRMSLHAYFISVIYELFILFFLQNLLKPLIMWLPQQHQQEASESLGLVPAKLVVGLTCTTQ